MKFFIDTANLDQIKEANDLGILDGVTTNPSLMAKEGFTGEQLKSFIMKFFIDTANLDQIKEANDLGILDGVTTNPSLMAKEGITGSQNILDHYIKICELVDGDVSAEVISTDF